MTTTCVAYGAGYRNLGLGLFDFSTHTFKMALTTSGYTPDSDVDEFFADITHEISGAGYTAGGQALTGLTWLYDTTNHRCVLSGDTVLWAALTPATRFGVIYRDTGDPGTSPLLTYVDFGADLNAGGGPLPVTFPDGVFRLLTPDPGPTGLRLAEEY
jgi:hypothetical protein